MKIQTKSQTTVDAFEYLKGNQGQAFTIKQVAEALGVTTAKVTGGLVSLAKKGIVERSEVAVGDKTFKAYTFAQDAEFAFEEPKNMSDKAVQLLQHMQANVGVDLTAGDIAESLGMVPIAINGVANGLVKRGLVVREAAEVEMPDGATKTIKFLVLTDEGKAYQF